MYGHELVMRRLQRRRWERHTLRTTVTACRRIKLQNCRSLRLGWLMLICRPPSHTWYHCWKTPTTCATQVVTRRQPSHTTSSTPLPGRRPFIWLHDCCNNASSLSIDTDQHQCIVDTCLRRPVLVLQYDKRFFIYGEFCILTNRSRNTWHLRYIYFCCIIFRFANVILQNLCYMVLHSLAKSPILTLMYFFLSSLFIFWAPCGRLSWFKC